MLSTVQFLRCILLSSFCFGTDYAYNIRPATEAEVSTARRILFQKAMNPFSISTETLVVASEKGGSELFGFGQIRPLDQDYSELASLYVVPERRSQGIGSAIVQELMDRHHAGDKTSRVCLLTLRPTLPFYEPFGFRIADEAKRKELPTAIQLEFQAGNALSFILGNELVCMIEEDS